MLLGLAIFAFCSWAVLGRPFPSGIIGKHLFSLSAILAFLVVMDRYNRLAAGTSIMLLVAGLTYSWYRSRHRHPVVDRKPRAF